MKQTDPQYKLRMPLELKEKVEAASKSSNRSMNAEIVARLESSFASELSESDDLPDAAVLTKASRSAIKNMKELIWKTIVSEIIDASKRGLHFASVSIDEVPGANGEYEEHQEIFEELKSQLEAKGYVVKVQDINDFDILWK